MSNEFINKLENDEKILFHEFSDISKTSKQYGRFLLGFIVLLLFWTLTIMGIQSNGILNFKIPDNMSILPSLFTLDFLSKIS